jgi:stearoyl-CoA desaturase (delta-9 desaturase)
LIVLFILHAGCFFAPLCFSWDAAIVCLALWFVSLCLGISIGWHRLLTHASFKTYKPVKYFFALCGATAMQGSLLRWVGIHRLHHRHSDSDGDPHSPREGFWWAHITWGIRNFDRSAEAQRCTSDLSSDRIFVLIDRWGLALCISMAAILYAIGGWPWIVWGMCVRLVLGFHSVMLVNSATHWWGYQNFRTTDNSRNNPLVALITFGEGWHNNHHAQQRSAAHGMRWWELDISYLIILALAQLGLAWDVVHPKKVRSSPSLSLTRNAENSTVQ